MATVVTDPYLQQIHTVRTRIHECFRHAHELLTLRETNLFTKLQEIQTINEANDSESYQEELQGLEVSKKYLKDNLRDNDTLNKALSAINDQIEEIMQLSSEVQTIRFHWNPDFEIAIQNAGEIITSSKLKTSDARKTSIGDIIALSISQTYTAPTLVIPEPSDDSIYDIPPSSANLITEDISVPAIPDDYMNTSTTVISFCEHIQVQIKHLEISTILMD